MCDVFVENTIHFQLITHIRLENSPHYVGLLVLAQEAQTLKCPFFSQSSMAEIYTSKLNKLIIVNTVLLYDCQTRTCLIKVTITKMGLDGFFPIQTYSSDLLGSPQGSL